MSQRRPQRSINRKLTLTVVLVTAVSLICTCLAFVAYDVVTLRRSMVREATSLANVIGVNSAAALAFQDRGAATETLEGLSAAREVTAARIYDREGRLFAHYESGGGPAISFEAKPRRDGHLFEGNLLHAFETIYFEDDRVGLIQLGFDTRALQRRIWHYAAIVALLLLATSGVGIVFAARLRRQIARPLAELVEGSEAIAAGDLSIRVKQGNDDEIGVLAGTFNTMAECLREVVDHVRGSIAEVSGITSGLRAGAREVDEEVQRQRTAIADTSESVEQVRASLLDVKVNVDEVSNFALETSSSMQGLDASIEEVALHMDQLAQSIDTTSTGANRVASNLEEVAGGVETLRSATEEATLRLGQLGSSVTQVRGNAEETRELAEDSHREATRGMKAVTETISAMRQIEGSFGDLQTQVLELSGRSQSIDQIIGVIREVAAETTLLSLNAAIIAAQAGEHGKAFSVVAEEVKRLAERTQRSTHEIAAITQAVQDGTRAAVDAVEKGSSRVKLGVERSNLAGQMLERILDKSQGAAALVETIFQASGQQSGDLERLDGAMDDVRRIVEQIQTSSREQQQATASIAKAVDQIRELGEDVRHSTDVQRQRSGLVAEASTDVAEKIQHISKATQAQAASSEKIRRALQTFRDVTEESARRSQAINVMVETLQERSHQLEREIDRFKR